MRFQLGNSFVNTKVPRKFTLCIRFQLGNSFVNTKVPRKFTLCIRFQLGNLFGATWKFSRNPRWMFGLNFILMLWMFGGGRGGFINTMLTLTRSDASHVAPFAGPSSSLQSCHSLDRSAPRQDSIKSAKIQLQFMRRNHIPCTNYQYVLLYCLYDHYDSGRQAVCIHHVGLACNKFKAVSWYSCESPLYHIIYVTFNVYR